ncbi:alpha/beta hydrolase fold domain-containing protein [Oceanospirillum linum]|nr:alpha/beta hydrolase [Oceanospirillum linum]SEG00153.1 Acetyl esterase/lipase [Oleiphilus messinensis]SMP22297.1 Acetyl esterase/lipase [Oceanospirillum linum]
MKLSQSKEIARDVVSTPLSAFSAETLKPLHPALEHWRIQFNQLLASLPPEQKTATPEAARQALAGITSRFVCAGPELYRVEGAVLGGDDLTEALQCPLPLMLYQAVEKPDALVLFVHGGGHVAGSIEVYDPICRRLAQESGQAVLAMDYPLAPANPWPAGIKSVAELMRLLPHVLDTFQLSPGIRVMMIGDSGGAAMAATLCLQQPKTLPGYPEALVLLYPSLDYRMQAGSIQQFSEGYFLTEERMRWYFDQYLQGRVEPLSVSPSAMPVPSHFPRTLLMSAGYDPLRDEAGFFFGKLINAGVDVDGVCYEQMLHAFLNLESLVPEACQDAYNAISRFLAAGRTKGLGQVKD